MMSERRRREVEELLRTRVRKEGGKVRYYADFRAFETAGGRWEALIPPGTNRATQDREEALLLADTRLTELQELERFTKPNTCDRRSLAVLATEWLIQRAKNRETTKQWLKDCERHMIRAAEFFGADRDLSSITPSEVKAWHSHLLHEAEHRGGVGFAEGSAHQHLCSLGALYQYGQDERVLTWASNPVPASGKRKVTYRITPYLEVPEMAGVLRFLMEDYQPEREDLAVPFAFEIVATGALTGARWSSIRRMEVDDVDFARKQVAIVKRRGKAQRSKVLETRFVPLFPQLEEVLRSYLNGPHAPKGRLLFPVFDDQGQERPVVDLRRVLNKVPIPPELDARARRLNGRSAEPFTSICFTMLRHTYCTARLQTLDGGKPISKHTVAGEMGHGSEAMINRVYGHLGRIRHRSEQVEYRW